MAYLSCYDAMLGNYEEIYKNYYHPIITERNIATK